MTVLTEAKPAPYDLFNPTPEHREFRNMVEKFSLTTLAAQARHHDEA